MLPNRTNQKGAVARIAVTGRSITGPRFSRLLEEIREDNSGSRIGIIVRDNFPGFVTGISGDWRRQRAGSLWQREQVRVSLGSTRRFVEKFSVQFKDPVMLSGKNLSSLFQRVRVRFKDDRRTEDSQSRFGSSKDQVFGPFHVDFGKIESPQPDAFAVIVERHGPDRDHGALVRVDKTSGAQIARALRRQVK